MDKWKIATGVILLLVGLGVTWKSYLAVKSCNSVLGKISTVITSLFGGGQAQACYNAQLVEVAGIIVLIIGIVILYTAYTKRGRRK